MTRNTLQAGALIALFILFALPLSIFAQSAADLQKQINDHNTQISQLNKEIAQYQDELKQTSQKKQTLQTTLAQLDISIKKTQAQITLLQNKISATQLRIQQLAGNIQSAQSSINANTNGLAQSFRAIAQESAYPMALTLFSDGTLTGIWNDVSASQSIQVAVHNHIQELAQAKKTYTNAKTETEAQQAQLVKQRLALQEQQGSLSAQKQSQSTLLAQTKSQESNFQKLISQKKSQEAQFEAALTDLKAQYQKALNPSAIPTAGKGILSWPLDEVTITQYFGNTSFAASGAYNGKGHNGIDLGAPIGTPVHAALTGVVAGTGNTDVGNCYSFGKWVYVKHVNGLGTIYAHLSEIDVSQGQSVTTGQLLGYSGETGYATGPHLHFGVYVSSATDIIKLSAATKTTTPCANVTMPVASLSAYLNPLNYLPAVP
jgi:murein DD-endopeptidase MepM/ murein hydrolase activator NlpD